MTNRERIESLGYKVKPMKIETVKTSGRETIVDVWLKYRDEYLKKNEDGSVENLKNGKFYTKEEYENEIFNMDLSVNYMEMILLNITSSTLFREFIFQFEDCICRWGRSSRDMAEFLTYCSEELADLPGTPKAYEEFKKVQEGFKAGDNSFDAMRECLPVAYQTDFMVYLPVKQFIKYIAVFYHAFHKILPETWRCIYVACYENPDLRPWLDKLSQYQSIEEVRLFEGTNKKFLPGKRGKDDHNKFILANRIYYKIGNIGSVLYSQMIRMEKSFTYGYYDFIKSLPQMDCPNCKVPFECYSSMSEERAEEIMNTRSAWFASNTYDGDPNAWNEFAIHHWIKNSEGNYSIEDNYKFFKFLYKEDGVVKVNQNSINRYIADDENRFHKDYNRFWINPHILGNDGRIMIDRLNQQGYSIHMDLWCQMWKTGLFKFDPENPYVKRWYKWIDEEGGKNTDYRKWDEVWNYYLTNKISVLNLMKKFKLSDY